MIKESIKRFKDDKVWVTKKCRIEAEARMNRNNYISQIIVNYYTFLVLALSIWAIIDKKSEYISILTVIASVGLFGISIFINSISYGERAYKYKDSYIRISKLENELESLLESDLNEYRLKEKFNEIRKKYNHILELTENHSEIDYMNVKINSSSSITADLMNKVNIYKFKISIFKVVVFLIPIILIILFYWRNN